MGIISSGQHTHTPTHTPHINEKLFFKKLVLHWCVSKQNFKLSFTEQIFCHWCKYMQDKISSLCILENSSAYSLFTSFAILAVIQEIIFKKLKIFSHQDWKLVSRGFKLTVTKQQDHRIPGSVKLICLLAVMHLEQAAAFLCRTPQRRINHQRPRFTTQMNKSYFPKQHEAVPI